MMRIDSRPNPSSIAVLSFQSGSKLISKVTAQTAITNLSINISHRETRHPFKPKANKRESIYMFSGERLVSTTIHCKGNYLSAIA